MDLQLQLGRTLAAFLRTMACGHTTSDMHLEHDRGVVG